MTWAVSPAHLSFTSDVQAKMADLEPKYYTTDYKKFLEMAHMCVFLYGCGSLSHEWMDSDLLLVF